MTKLLIKLTFISGYGGYGGGKLFVFRFSSFLLPLFGILKKYLTSLNFFRLPKWLRTTRFWHWKHKPGLWRWILPQQRSESNQREICKVCLRI